SRLMGSHFFALDFGVAGRREGAGRLGTAGGGAAGGAGRACRAAYSSSHATTPRTASPTGDRTSVMLPLPALMLRPIAGPAPRTSISDSSTSRGTPPPA